MYKHYLFSNILQVLSIELVYQVFFRQTNLLFNFPYIDIAGEFYWGRSYLPWKTNSTCVHWCGCTPWPKLSVWSAQSTSRFGQCTSFIPTGRDSPTQSWPRQCPEYTGLHDGEQTFQFCAMKFFIYWTIMIKDFFVTYRELSGIQPLGMLLRN